MVWGAMGLTTRSSPRSPVTRAARWRTDRDHMEQWTVAVWPLGKASSASMARSISGLWSLAVADTTRGLLAAEQPGPVDHVGAHVHHGPAGQVGLVADVRLVGDGGAQPRLDVADLPELAAVDDLAHPVGQRVVAVVEGLHHHQAVPLGGPVGRRRHPLGLGGVGR